MASLKEVKARIISVGNTKKITLAMKMVASAKLHKAQLAIEQMLPYEQTLHSILSRFISTEEEGFSSPYLAQRELKRVAIVPVSSNSSLCGAFNNNISKRLSVLMTEYQALGTENILLFPVGKKITDAVLKQGYQIQGDFQNLSDKPTYAESMQLAEKLMDMFVKRTVDKVVLLYNHFKTTAVQVVTVDTFLPLSLSVEKQNNVSEGYLANFIVEPNVSELLPVLLQKVIKLKLFTAFLDSSAAEHAARTVAMQIATDNADELLTDLTIMYNKSRQQAITNELLDIVGGSMA